MENKIDTGMSKFYLAVVLLLMLVLPCISTGIESRVTASSSLLPLMAGKWFIFWGAGVRLFSAGLKQVINPAFTAQSIFHLQDKESLVVVKELGFANICIGLAGLVSLFKPGWRIVAACIGGLYFGIAGINHIIKKPVGANEWIALVSDIFIFIIMLAYSIANF